MSTSEIKIILRALDEASATLRKAADTIEGKLTDVEKANDKVEKSSKKVEMSTKDVALAWNNAATGAFALYNAVDRVMDMQVSLNRANLQVKASAKAVEDAQRRYNDAVEKFGPNSEKALAAQKDLQLAQERYNYSVERADMLQGNFNEAIVQSALTVIPSLITVATSAKKILEGLGNAQEGFNKALSALSSPLGISALGIGGLAAVVGIVWNAFDTAAKKAEQFRKEGEEITSMVQKARAAFDMKATSLAALRGKYEACTSALSDLNQQLDVQQRRLIELDKELQSLTKRSEAIRSSYSSAAKDAVDAQTYATASMRNEVQKRIDLLEEEIAATQRAAEASHRNLTVGQVVFEQFTKGTEAYEASLAQTASLIATILGDISDDYEQKLNKASAVVAMFAGKWKISWTDAERALSKAIENLKKPIEEIAEAAEENLVSDAQNALQTFVDCSSRKYDKLREQADAYAQELEEKFGKAYQEPPWQAEAPPPYIPGVPFGWKAFNEPPWTVEIPELGPLPGIPVAPQSNVNNNIEINIEGSVDRETLHVIKKELENVLVEASSASAPISHKRIRLERLLLAP